MNKTITIVTPSINGLENFIEEVAQLALFTNMINMTGVGTAITVTLLDADVLLIIVPTDSHEIKITTDLMKLNDHRELDFTLNARGKKLKVHAPNSLGEAIRLPLSKVMDIYIHENDKLNIPVEPKLEPRYWNMGHIYPQYSEQPMQPQPYWGFPQHAMPPAFPNQQPSRQPQQPMRNQPFPMDPMQSLQPTQRHWEDMARAGGRMPPRSGNKRDEPIHQGFTPDDDKGVEGRNERPGG